MATPTLLSSAFVTQVQGAPGVQPALQLGMIVVVIACVAVLAVVVQIVKAMAQAAQTMMHTIAPVFVVVAGAGAVLVLAVVTLAGHG